MKKKKNSKHDHTTNEEDRRNSIQHNNNKQGPVKSNVIMERLGFFTKETRNNMDFFKERQGKLVGTPMKMMNTTSSSSHNNNNNNEDNNNNNNNDVYREKGSTKKEKEKERDNYEKKNMMSFQMEPIDMSPRKLKENLKNINENKNFFFQMSGMDMSPRKLKENLKQFNENIEQEDANSPRKMNEALKANTKIKTNPKMKMESQYILNNVQSKFIRRHYIKKVLRDLSSIEYLILCAFTRLYKKDILPKTLYVIILEINKFKQAYPQEQIIGFSNDAYRRSFFRLVDLDIIILSSYSLSHLNIKNFSNDLFGLHEPTKFPCYDIFLDNIDTYNLNHNLIQWVKHNIEVMQ